MDRERTRKASSQCLPLFYSDYLRLGLSMNYQRIYDEFIKDRRIKELTISGYTEKHHIIPRSHGGDNSKGNLIKLSAQDHYFAHELLAKIHGGKMSNALWMMTTSKKYKTSRVAYEIAKKNQAEQASKIAIKYLLGREKGEGEVERISESLKKYFKENGHPLRGRKKPLHENEKTSRALLKYYENNHGTRLGMKNSEETNQKLRDYMLSDKNHFRGKTHTDEHKRKIGEAQIGDKNHSYKHQVYRFSKDGCEDFIGTQNEFYKKFNFNKNGASRLCTGKYKAHKGWSAEKLDV